MYMYKRTVDGSKIKCSKYAVKNEYTHQPTNEVDILFPESITSEPERCHQQATNGRYQISWFVWQAAHNGWSIVPEMKSWIGTRAQPGFIMVYITLAALNVYTYCTNCDSRH